MKRSDGRVAERLESLAAQWSLSELARQRLGELLTLVRDDPRAATSVRTPAQAVDVHVADSLSALPWLAGASRAADVGSGAGFPGLPLAIARPDLAVDLIESAGRKCEFLRDAVRGLGLEHVRVITARAEDWAREEGREQYDAVLVRAVAPLATLAEYAAPLLRRHGTLVAWKGEPDAEEERTGLRAALQVGLEPAGRERVMPFPGSLAHTLYLYEKSRPTPDRFPRRAGAARKRPLG